MALVPAGDTGKAQNKRQVKEVADDEEKDETKRPRKDKQEDEKKRKASEEVKNPKNSKQLKQEPVLCNPAASQSTGSATSDTSTIFCPHGLYFKNPYVIRCLIGGNVPL